MALDGTSRAVVRLGIGLVQGAILAGLFLADDHKVFPATLPQVFAPLVAVAVFIPLIVSQSLGNLRRTTLIAWSVTATAIVAGLAWYDVWHAWQPPGGPGLSARIGLILAVFLFVAHALVSCGDADRRIVARYPTLFDLAWKLGVQAAIIVCFLGAFWIMLWLGIALFNMIGFTGFGRFVTDAAVAIPLTTIAAAAALHATDTSAPLVRGVRGLALTLLSWLLPVIALIALAFLVSLAVTGLQPLWATRTAALLLIAAAAVLVIHINAAYQDGSVHPPHILRVAGTLASVLLVFLVWIAAYALWLRVSQYGWTVDRVTSAACVAVAGMFAAGYLIAALLPGPWLKFIEHWNVYSTFFCLIVLFALATPIADPMRLAVNDQVARLKAGVVKPEKFDFGYLAYHGGRFGHEALETLRKSDDRQIAALAAKPHLDLMFRHAAKHYSEREIAAAITMHPAGKSLPATFLKQDWGKFDYSEIGGIEACFTGMKNYRCDAVEADVDGDGHAELVVVHSWRGEGFVRSLSGWVYRLTGDHWKAVAEISVNGCSKSLDPLLAGNFTLVAPLFRDLKIGDDVVHLRPMISPRKGCPAPGVGFITEPRSAED